VQMTFTNSYWTVLLKMSEKKIWDKILGDPRRCRWFYRSRCTTLNYTGPIRHFDGFPLCKMKVCEDYEERDQGKENVGKVTPSQ